jgi:hypothetical protein
MANSPSHKFGQDLGNLLEHVVLYLILKPRLEEFTKEHRHYLDWQTERPVRPGKKKVTWQDRYGNNHDLDFVIEAGGTPSHVGTPVAFIEAAWRRYTKHSKNKVQEIQGAILPIVELHKLSAPFFGAVLAGDFTKPALDQLRNNQFTVLYIPYKDVVAAFQSVKFDIAFNEETPDKVFASANAKLAALSERDKDKIRNALTRLAKSAIDTFMDKLRSTLERVITQIVIIPLFGHEVRFSTLSDAVAKLGTLELVIANGELQKIDVLVAYSNDDIIRASFSNLAGAASFLSTLR